MNDEILKTPKEWLNEPQWEGVMILDPDGWDRANFQESWNEPITADEMMKRTMQSTIVVTKVT